MLKKFRLRNMLFLILLSLILTGCSNGSPGAAAPTFTIEGVEDEGEYWRPVTVIVTLGPDTKQDQLKLNGKDVDGTKPIHIDESGEYALYIVVKNIKNEGSFDEIRFTVDLESPVFEITGVQEGYNGRPVIPEITTANVRDQVSAKLNGSDYTFGQEITYNGEYELEVTVTGENGRSKTVTIHFEVGPPIPGQPQDLTVSLGDHCVELAWAEQEDAEGYMIYRATDEAGSDRTGLTDELVQETAFADYDVEEGKTYWYWVEAHKGDQTSPLSEPVKSPLMIFDRNFFRVPDDYPTIQAAIDAAYDYDTIIIAPGRYRENLVLHGKNITIQSTDPSDPATVAATIIDGGQADTVISVENAKVGVKISGLTITNGIGKTVDNRRKGGGIYAKDSVISITYNVIQGNIVANPNNWGFLFDGGGVYIDNEGFDAAGTTAITVESNIIIDNSTTGGSGGGLYAAGDNQIIVGNTFRDNISLRNGGGLYVTGDNVLIERNTIVANIVTNEDVRSNSSAGGLQAFGNNHRIINNEVRDNEAYFDGAGLMVEGNGHTISDNQVIGNSNGSLYIIGSDCVITNNVVTENSSGFRVRGDLNEITDNRSTLNAGSGISVGGNDNIIERNRAKENQGTGLGVGGDDNMVTFNDSEDNFGLGMSVSGSNNRAEENNIKRNMNGGLSVSGSINTARKNFIWDNGSNSVGAGIRVSGSGHTIEWNDVKNNYSNPRAYPVGGGLFIEGTSHIVTNNTVTGNKVAGMRTMLDEGNITHTGGQGGGMYVMGEDHTIEGNHIIDNESFFDGGGLYVEGSEHRIEKNEVSENRSGSGGGMYITADQSTIADNQVSKNKATGAGGGIYLSGRDYKTVTRNVIQDNRVIDNTAASSGGGFYIYNGLHQIFENTVDLNISNGSGGGFFIGGWQVEHGNTIENNKVRDNKALSGGGLYASGGTQQIADNEINGNVCADEGGGLYLGASRGTIVSGNSIENNASSGHGGGLFVDGGEGKVSGNDFIRNKSDGDGGALYLMGNSRHDPRTVVLTQNLFEKNDAAGNGRTLWVGKQSLLIDGEGQTLHDPALRNKFKDMDPGDVYYE